MVGPLLLVVWGPSSLMLIYTIILTQLFTVLILCRMSSGHPHVNQILLGLKKISFVLTICLLIVWVLSHVEVYGLIITWRQQIYEIFHTGMALMMTFLVCACTPSPWRCSLVSLVYYISRCVAIALCMMAIHIFFPLPIVAWGLIFVCLIGPHFQSFTCTHASHQNTNTRQGSVFYFCMLLFLFAMNNLLSSFRH